MHLFTWSLRPAVILSDPDPRSCLAILSTLSSYTRPSRRIFISKFLVQKEERLVKERNRRLTTEDRRRMRWRMFLSGWTDMQEVLRRTSVFLLVSVHPLFFSLPQSRHTLANRGRPHAVVPWPLSALLTVFFFLAS